MEPEVSGPSRSVGEGGTRRPATRRRQLAWEPRTYRASVAPAGLTCFEVMLRETDLQICATRDLSAAALELVSLARTELESYIARDPRFAESYVPVAVAPDAPRIVADMARVAAAVGVGPMAAVAGAVAQYVAEGLAELSDEVIVENGGDVYLIGATERTLALWAGEHGAQGVGLVIAPGELPLGVCTSSGRIGPSKSFGEADAMTVLARDGALADAAATALGNRIHGPADLEAVLEAARGIDGLAGVVATIDGHIGAWGAVRLTALPT